jgi:nucleotide-binding universal stress UspA family protein
VTRNVGRILVATDFSDDARSALEGARAIARNLSAELQILYVWQPPLGIALAAMTTTGRGQTLSDVARAEATRHLQALLRESQRPAPSPRVEIGVPDEVIVTLADSGRFDLIVMGASGVGANVARLGSVTRRVLGSAPCPVLTLRAPGPPGASPEPAKGVGS